MTRSKKRNIEEVATQDLVYHAAVAVNTYT